YSDPQHVDRSRVYLGRAQEPGWPAGTGQPAQRPVPAQLLTAADTSERPGSNAALMSYQQPGRVSVQNCRARRTPPRCTETVQQCTVSPAGTYRKLLYL